MQLVRFEVQNLDHHHLESQDPTTKEPNPNKEMSKTCGPQTTPSQQDRTQATKGPTTMDTTALQTAFLQKFKSQSGATSDRKKTSSQNILRSSHPRFFRQKTAQRNQIQTRKCQKPVVPRPHQANRTGLRLLNPWPGPTSSCLKV
jgi:hypothetical protein